MNDNGRRRPQLRPRDVSWWLTGRSATGVMVTSLLTIVSFRLFGEFRLVHVFFSFGHGCSFCCCGYGYYGQLWTASTERRRFPALARTSRERNDGSPRIRRIRNGESARNTTLTVVTKTTRVQLNYCCARTKLYFLLRVSGGTRVGLNNKKIEKKIQTIECKIYIIITRWW